MRNQTTRFSATMKNLGMTVVMVCLLVVSAFANSGKNKAFNISTPVTVKYLGKIDAQPVVHIQVENNQEEELQLSLQDEQGNIIYSDKFNEKNYSRKFQLNLDNTYGVNFSLVLFGKKGTKTERFQINNVTKVVEEIIVEKVK